MPFATILVSVDFEPACKSRISLAAGLARRFNALLIGIAGWPLLKAGLHSVPTTEIPTLESAKWVSTELHKLGQEFRAASEDITDQVEWRSSMDFPRDVIPREARAADLVVIGQDFLPGDVFHTYDPGAIILDTGRPVLVVPRQIDHLEVSRVFIAWKDTREARRAIRDALPFLKQAKKVCIAVAKTPGAGDTDAQVADVMQYLGWHQITNVEQISTVADDSEETLLVDLAKQHHIDLIVAGAYGRTRLSEWIFGGVTRYLLVNSPIPCLFSN